VAKVEQAEALRRAGYTSAADHAYQVICDKILKGELKPGTKLTRRAMARLTGVSIIPVIEALHRLENEGLVESLPYYGANVIKMTPEAVRDRFSLRLAVECQVARMLSRVVDDEGAGQLLPLAEKLDARLAEAGGSEDAWEMHYDFHVGLARLTGCGSLVDALHRIHLFLLLEWKRIASVTDELGSKHTWMVEEIARGDPEVAEAAVRRHIASSGLLPADLVP
jgi:DNA-binding GntR family transcriptional regulator